MIVGIAAALGAAVTTRALGFSLEMGAFLAGFVLAPTPFRHQLGGQIGPLRDLFLAVFFTVLGMSLDPNILVEAWEVVALGVGAVILIKIFAIGLFVWMVGTRGGTALAVGLALAQGGEFSLVLVGAALDYGILEERASVTAIAVVVITLVLTPLLTALGFRLQPRISLGLPPWSGSRQAQSDSGLELSDGVVGPHVVVAGYGPTGRAVVDRLSAEDISCTVVELNPATVRNEKRGGKGRRFILGDASNFEVLESAGLAEADALVLTMPDEGAILRAAARARAEHPDLYIAVRTGALSSVEAMMEAGVNHVTAEESAAADALAVCVTARLGKSVDPRMPAGSE
jgi:CPA2 family monovalent cation:H+ antiporter-2